MLQFCKFKSLFACKNTAQCMFTFVSPRVLLLKLNILGNISFMLGGYFWTIFEI